MKERAENLGAQLAAKEAPTQNATTAVRRAILQSTVPRKEKERATMAKEQREKRDQGRCRRSFMETVSTAEKRVTLPSTALKKEKEKDGGAAREKE